ncbi:hypothetical protein B0H14DRAFT_2565286 [Mycena olivaceomarginata]|nr:hypothetical protein B0H14DRAFT_2565286 [Mycena olivaceomarginata]
MALKLFMNYRKGELSKDSVEMSGPSNKLEEQQEELWLEQQPHYSLYHDSSNHLGSVAQRGHWRGQGSRSASTPFLTAPTISVLPLSPVQPTLHAEKHKLFNKYYSQIWIASRERQIQLNHLFPHNPMLTAASDEITGLSRNAALDILKQRNNLQH